MPIFWVPNEHKLLKCLAKKLVEQQIGQALGFGERTPLGDAFSVSFHFRTSKPDAQKLAAVSEGSAGRRKFSAMPTGAGQRALPCDAVEGHAAHGCSCAPPMTAGL
jgi:hypothetical protein